MTGRAKQAFDANLSHEQRGDIEQSIKSVMNEMTDSMTSLEEVMNAQDPGKRAEILDRIFHANLGMTTTGLSPAALVVAYTDWYTQTLMSPNMRLELIRSACNKQADFWNNISEYLYKKNTDCFDTKDRRFHERFTSDYWKEWPYCAIAQSFLRMEDWWQEATEVRGLEKNHKELVSFVLYQWLNVLSPENIPFLNPHLGEKIIDTKGQNLIDGLKNWQDDFQRRLMGEKPAGAEQFIVGQDVAITPGKVVYRNDLIELIQYTPQTKTVYPEPMLIIPAWIMKYYILDLSPHNSMVDYLVKKGHSVFMISWKNPDATYRDYGMQDYLKRGILAALDAITAITGQKQIHTAGYCIGGTLLVMAASYLARHHDKRLKTISLFAAQTDFEEAGELMTFIDENQLCYLEDIMFSQGYLRGDQMSSTFNLLRSKELIWSKSIQRYLLGERNKMTDLLAWNEDTTRLPYKLHAEYLRDLHLNNELAEGEYKIDGAPVTIEDIETPLFVVATEKDHIAPWKSVYKIHLYAKLADITFVLANKGHNGGILSEPGHAKRSYRLGKTSASSHFQAPESWYAGHKSHKGSWWAPWHRWIASASGKKGTPPSMGAPEKGYEVLDDAPGTYVREK